MFIYDRGILIAGSNLWLDAELKKDFSFVSHGHGDHVRPHRKILATPATVRFHGMRVKQHEAVELEFEKVYTHDGLSIQLFPAGHILGSAMIRLEKGNLSLLYTGDFKMRRSYTAEPIKIPNADILIMECTYGKPEYRFCLSQGDLVDKLVSLVEDGKDRGFNPGIMAYSLGKAQEAMKILGDLGYSIKVHQQAWKYADVYTDFGIDFKNCYEWHGEQLHRGEILIFPPHLSQTRYIRSLIRLRTVFLSGWASNSTGPGNHYRSHDAIPFSDHADFDDLIRFVIQVNPKKVYTTHGFEEFPQYLRKIGFDAQVLRTNLQMQFF